MQRGCIKRNSRKRGPEVWQFRWSEIGPDGKRHHHKKIIGTVEQYPDENAARRAVVGLVSEINAGTRPMNPSAMTPIYLVRQSAKRRTAPAVLIPAEIKALINGLALRERTLVLLAASTGLRQSELFGLKWAISTLPKAR